MDKKNRIYIIEGFDGVGKDWYVHKMLSDKEFYRPNHDLFDKFIGRQESWVIGASIFDFLSRISKTSVEVVINRCIASSLVYSEMYNGKLHLHPNLNKLIEFYKNNKHFQQANHLHICHSDMASARKIYECVNKRPDNDEYDVFDGFSEYWKNYCYAETLFAKYYKLLGIKPEYIYHEYQADQSDDTPKMCKIYSDQEIVSAMNLGLCEFCVDKCYEEDPNEVTPLH